MAPELMQEDVMKAEGSIAALDIYSFGITMFAVMARAKPFSETKQNLWALRDSIVGGMRPSLSHSSLLSAPFAAMGLMQKCWESNPAARPASFREICEVLGGYEFRSSLLGRESEIEHKFAIRASVATPSRDIGPYGFSASNIDDLVPKNTVNPMQRASGFRLAKLTSQTSVPFFGQELEQEVI